MTNCQNCKHLIGCTEAICIAPNRYRPTDCFAFEPKPKTNFDNVTASPEALAKFINDAANLAYHEHCFIPGPCYNTADCEKCITQWLKQEMRDKE